MHGSHMKDYAIADFKLPRLDVEVVTLIVDIRNGVKTFDAIGIVFAG